MESLQEGSERLIKVGRKQRKDKAQRGVEVAAAAVDCLYKRLAVARRNPPNHFAGVKINPGFTVRFDGAHVSFGFRIISGNVARSSACVDCHDILVQELEDRGYRCIRVELFLHLDGLQNRSEEPVECILRLFCALCAHVFVHCGMVRRSSFLIERRRSRRSSFVCCRARRHYAAEGCHHHQGGQENGEQLLCLFHSLSPLTRITVLLHKIGGVHLKDYGQTYFNRFYTL